MTAGEAEAAVTTALAAAQFRVDHLAMLAAPLATIMAGADLDYLVKAPALLASRAGDRPRRTLLPVLQHESHPDREIQCAEK